jgi:Rieske Fe-S protein
MDPDAPTQHAGEQGADAAAQTPDRRRFLEIGLLTSVGVAGLAFMGAGGRFVVGDALTPQQQQWVQVGEVAKLPAGQVQRATYTARSKDAWRTSERKGLLYVYSDDGATFTVLDGTCTHLGCNVQWTDENQGFHCPCHRALFSRAGAVVDGPAPRPLAQLQTKIENGVLFALI